MAAFREEQLKELGTVQAAIQQDDANKRDLLVKLKNIEIITETFAGREHHRFKRANDQQTTVRLRVNSGVLSEPLDLGFDIHRGNYSAYVQFCRQIRVPPNYLLDCPPSLAKLNFDTWLSMHGEEDVLLRYRTEGPENTGAYLRAVLPATYGIIDNHQIFPMVSEACEEFGMQSTGWRLTDYGFYNRIVNPQEVIPVGSDGSDGDPVWIGFSLANSETGNRATATIDYMVFELVCSNGMISLREGRRLLKQKHVQIEPATLRQGIREAIQCVQNNGEEIVKEYAEARNTEVEDPEAEIRALWAAKNLGLSNIQPVLDVWEDKYKDIKTRAGVVRALTDASQRFGSPDLRLKIDEVAGLYLQRGLVGVGLEEQAA